jgi:hypothetical protein
VRSHPARAGAGSARNLDDRIRVVLPNGLGADDTGTPISEEYVVPFRFAGELKKVVLKLGKNSLAAADQQEVQRLSKDQAGRE